MDDEINRVASNPLPLLGSYRLQPNSIQNRSEARIRNRTAHEERRLLKNSSRTLAKQILGLLDDEQHSDLLVECGHQSWHCHSILLLARSPRLHSVLLSRFQVQSPPSTTPASSSPSTSPSSSQLPATVANRRQIRLPAVLLAQFDLNCFLRCLYSGQDVNTEQSLLLDHLRRLPSVEQDLDAFALDLQPLTAATLPSGPSSATLKSMDRPSIVEEPLYVNLAAVHKPLPPQKSHPPPPPTSASSTPKNDVIIVDKQVDNQQQQLIQLTTSVSDAQIVVDALQTNSLTKQKSELDSEPADSGLPEFSSFRLEMDTKDTETERLLIDTTLDSQLLIQLATEATASNTTTMTTTITDQQLAGHDHSSQESTRPADELFLQSDSVNQIKTGHTMSDVSEITDEVPSAQEIVDRMLYVHRFVDIQSDLDAFGQKLLRQPRTTIGIEPGNGLDQQPDQHVMARLNSFDSADSADLLEKLTRIEQEEQQWRLRLQLDQDLMDDDDAVTPMKPTNVASNRKQSANSMGSSRQPTMMMMSSKGDASTSKSTNAAVSHHKNVHQEERGETPASTSSMIRSSTFDLLSYKKPTSNASTDHAVNEPTNISLVGNVDSEELVLLDCDEQQMLERTLIESPQCLLQYSLHTLAGNIPPPPPPPAAVRRSGNTMKNSTNSRSSLNRRTQSATQASVHNSSSDFDAVNRGFMFISIEDDEALVDDSFNQLISASPLDTAMMESTNACNILERRKPTNRRNRSAVQRIVAECAECGSSGCGSECEEQRRLLHSSLLSCSKLGEDLLWLFLLQTDCDTRLLVDEGKRWLGAHRCILAARSEFLRKKLADTRSGNTTMAGMESTELQQANQSNLPPGRPTDTESSPEDLNLSDDSPAAELLDESEQNFLIAPQPALFSLDCLADFSFPAVHFALCHIYSGTLVLPNFAHSADSNAVANSNDPVNESATVGPSTTGTSSLPYTNVPLAELLHLCELLQLPHLQQAIVAAIRHHLCHQFHSPCSKCLSGVCQTVKLAERCDLTALHGSCIRWLAKHFVNICTHKCFVELLANERPLDSTNSIRKGHSTASQYNKTAQQTGNNATTDSTSGGTIGKRPKLSVRLLEAIQERLNQQNVLDTGLALQRGHVLISQIRNRSPQLLQLVQRALDTCVQMIGDQMDAILCGESFDRLLQCHAWQMEPLQQLFDLAINNLDTDGACRAMCALEQLFALYNPTEQQHLQQPSSHQPQQPFGFSRSCLEEPQLQLLRYLRKRVERLLVQRANEAVYCESWSLLSNGLQHHIQNTAMLVFEFEKPLAKRPLLSSSMRKASQSEQQSSGEHASDSNQVALATELASRSQHGCASPRRVPSTISGRSNLSSSQRRPGNGGGSGQQRSATSSKGDRTVKSGTPMHQKSVSAKTSRSKKPPQVSTTTVNNSKPNDGLVTTETADSEEEEAHIYDEVPFDLQQIVAERQSIGKNGHPITLIEHNKKSETVASNTNYANTTPAMLKSTRTCSQVVKVSPFTQNVDTTVANSVDNVNVNDNLIHFSVNENLHLQTMNENQENLYENLRQVSSNKVEQQDRFPVNSLLKQADQLHQRLSQKLSEGGNSCSTSSQQAKTKNSHEINPSAKSIKPTSVSQRQTQNGTTGQRNVARTRTIGHSASRSRPPFK